jgi:hypothetical protein
MVRGAATAAVVGEGFEEMAESARRGIPVSVRIPVDLARRLERPLPKRAEDSVVSTLGVINASAVLKLALLRGGAVREGECG